MPNRQPTSPIRRHRRNVQQPRRSLRRHRRRRSAHRLPAKARPPQPPSIAATRARLRCTQPCASGRRAALDVVGQPAPSQSDLLGAARTAGMLTRLAQNLIIAHADPSRPGDTSAAVSQHLRRAGAQLERRRRRLARHRHRRPDVQSREVICSAARTCSSVSLRTRVKGDAGVRASTQSGQRRLLAGVADEHRHQPLLGFGGSTRATIQRMPPPNRTGDAVHSGTSTSL